MAAAACVLRPPGWVKLVAAAGEEVQRADAERAGEEGRRELDRLREELAEARAHTKAETERLRTELEAARKEAESLHRKLRSAQSDVKRGEAALRRVRPTPRPPKRRRRPGVGGRERDPPPQGAAR